MAMTAVASRAAWSAGAAVAASALVAAACGSAPAPAGGAGPGAKVSLHMTFTASPGAPAVRYTLRCDPAGGTVPDPAAACTRLLTGASIFAPRPAHILCPMIMVSAARATVTGTYFGRSVHVTIVDGGCDLSRWAKLKSVVS